MKDTIEERLNSFGKMVVCGADNFHPYECNGIKGKCIHCIKKHAYGHKPKECWLCCDGDPKTYKQRGISLAPLTN